MTTVPAPIRSFSIPRSVSVAFAIGRFEARKALRNPLVILAALAACAYTVWQTWTRIPVLNRYDAVAAEGLIPLAVVLLLIANMATIRSRRHNTTELFDGLVTSAPTRTVGHLISVLIVASVSFVLLIVQLGYLKAIGGVTAPRLEVLLLGPALVAFGGAFGIAIGRWAPHLFVAPLGLAGLVAFSAVVSSNAYTHDREWLSLWVGNDAIWSVTESTFRPYDWRLVYLLGLAGLAVAVAFIKHTRPRRIAAGLALVALVVAALAANRQMDGASDGSQTALVRQLIAGYEDPKCRVYAGITYCPMPGYEPWIDRWREPAEGVLVAVPAEARPTDLRFLQAVGEWEMYDDERNALVVAALRRERRRGILALEKDIHPTLSWGRNGNEERNELDVALAVAVHAVGIDHFVRFTKPEVQELRKQTEGRLRVRPGRVYRQCSSVEQGRAIVALWLGAQATEGSRAGFDDAASQNPFVASPSEDPDGWFETTAWSLDASQTFGSTSVHWGTREMKYAEVLLRSEDDLVRGLLARNWAQLVDPATTTDEAASILGLTPLPSLKEVFENWHPNRTFKGVRTYGMLPCQ